MARRRQRRGWGRSARAIVVVLAASAFCAVPAEAAGARLELNDGSVLEGISVEREGDLYVLLLEGGAKMPIPVELVAEVALTGDPEPEAKASREAPSGLKKEEPRVLAGKNAELPTRDQQLEVLGEPAGFRRDVVRSNLGPRYWVMDPRQSNWGLAKWSRGPIDPTWKPESAFDAKKDVLGGSRSVWPKPVIDSTWQPKDGFNARPRSAS